MDADQNTQPQAVMQDGQMLDDGTIVRIDKDAQGNVLGWHKEPQTPAQEGEA